MIAVNKDISLAKCTLKCLIMIPPYFSFGSQLAIAATMVQKIKKIIRMSISISDIVLVATYQMLLVLERFLSAAAR